MRDVGEPNPEEFVRRSIAERHSIGLRGVCVARPRLSRAHNFLTEVGVGFYKGTRKTRVICARTGAVTLRQINSAEPSKQPITRPYL
jgi:hypothetical protein